MLASLFGKKSDHPLASLKSAQQVLDVIPKTDSIKAVAELSGWVESLRDHASEFSLDHLVLILGLLDEASQPHLKKLQRDYFTLMPQNKFQENRLWGTLNGFYILCEQVYSEIFTQCRKNERGMAFPKAQMAMLASRALFTLSNRLKMAAVRYEQIDSALWAHIAEIYNYAGKNDFLEETVFLYPATGINTSPKREFANLIVWYSMGTGSLTPIHLHIAERLITHLNKFLEVGTHVSTGCLWAFNLLQPSAPTRVSGEGTIHPSLRFIGIGGLENGLNDLIRTLAKGVVPQEINLYGSSYDAVLIGEVARQLLARCETPPPTRKNARRKLNVNLHVSNGLQNLFENAETGLGFSEAESEIWEVEDVSSTGFRSVVSPVLLGSVKIGSLIGSKPENVMNWGVGIVRRLSRDAQNNLQVGVETLSNQVISVALKVADRSGKDESAKMAMYLNRLNDNSGEAWLLMSPGTYVPSRSFNLELSEKNYLLLTLELVESGDDYDLARYRKMEQDSNE
jgi:hypothetical protein